MNSTKKKSFFVAVICLVLCVALLVGTTFAWFTDSVSNTGNKIQAGTLDVDLLQYNKNSTAADKYDSIAGQTESIFTSSVKWEPGQTQSAYLAVKNNGNLALKYNLLLDITDKETNADLTQAMAGAFDFVIINNIDGKDAVTSWEAAKTAAGGSSTNLLSAIQVENPGQKSGRVTAAPQGQLAAGASDKFAVVLHMNEEAGNAYQNGLIEIDVNVVATQLNAELDGFSNPDYDKDATFPALAPYINSVTPATVSAAGAKVEISDDTAKSTVPASVKKEGSEEMIQIKKSTEVIDSSVKKDDYQMAASSNLTRFINTTAATETSVTYDISYVYTENSKSYDVSEFASMVTNEIKLSKGLKDVTVTHSHGGTPVSMNRLTEMPSATPSDSSYYYNESTGSLYIWSRLYSEYTITYRSDFVASIGDTGYTSFYDALDAAKDGDKIVLLSDITVNNKDAEYDNFSAINIEKAITIDGKGHSITGKDFTTATTNSVISITNYPTPIAGTVTLKNLTVNADGEAVKHCINVYGATAVLENITVNMKNGSKGYAVISNGANGVSNVTIKGEGTVINAGTWGALNVDQNNGSSITLEAGTVNGLVNVERGLFTMTGGTIKSTYAVNVTAGTDKTSVANISGGTVYGSITKDTKGGETISITGGTFDNDPSAYVPTGYKAYKNDTTPATWTVKVKTAPVPVEGVFSAANDSELADVIEEIIANNAYWNTPYTIQLGAATYSGTYDIFQYPEWNGLYGTSDTYYNYKTKQLVPGGTTNIPFASANNANKTKITIKGVNGTVFTGKFIVWGFGYSNGGNPNISADNMYTVFDGLTFDQSSLSAKAVPLEFTGASSNVTVKNCSFNKTERVMNGYSQIAGGYSFDFTMSHCDFIDCAAVVGNYLAGNNNTIEYVTATGLTSGFLNAQTGGGSSSVVINNCSGQGKGYGVRLQGGFGQTATVNNSTLNISGGDNYIVAFKGNSGSHVILNNVTIPSGGSKVVNSATTGNTVVCKGTTPAASTFTSNGANPATITDDNK